jgi:hypothetical protein
MIASGSIFPRLTGSNGGESEPSWLAAFGAEYGKNAQGLIALQILSGAVRIIEGGDD